MRSPLIDYILEHPEGLENGRKWNYSHLAENKTFPPEIRATYPHLPWLGPPVDLTTLKVRELMDYLQNGKYELKDIFQLPAVIRCPKKALDYVAINNNLSIEDILNHPEIPWSKNYLSARGDLRLDLLLNPPPNWIGEFCPSLVAMHNQMGLKAMNEYFGSESCRLGRTASSEFEARFEAACWNRHHPVEELIQYARAHDWDSKIGFFLNANPGLRIQDILAHPEIDWNPDCFYSARLIPLEWTVTHYPQVKLGVVGSRPDLTLNFLLRFPEAFPNDSSLFGYIQDPHHRIAAFTEMTNSLSRLFHLPRDMLGFYLDLYLPK